MADQLAALFADPQRAADVPLEQVPALLAAVAALQGALAARLLAAPAESRRPEPQVEGDRLLTAGQAAAIAGVASKWLYRRAKTLPFARRLGPKTIRFSEHGLRRWLAARKA